MVRYGNVVGSRGTVVPLFQQADRRGRRSLPITDARMTRFWITLQQGVDFVLSSLALMRGGEIFVPKIPSMKIIDLAKAMAPGWRIEIVGIRPGEKLHEMMITADDARSTLELDDRYVIEPAFPFWTATIWMQRRHGRCRRLPLSSDTNTEWLTPADAPACMLKA